MITFYVDPTSILHLVFFLKTSFSLVPFKLNICCLLYIIIKEKLSKEMFFFYFIRLKWIHPVDYLIYVPWKISSRKSNFIANGNKHVCMYIYGHDRRVELENYSVWKMRTSQITFALIFQVHFFHADVFLMRGSSHHISFYFISIFFYSFFEPRISHSPFIHQFFLCYTSREDMCACERETISEKISFDGFPFTHECIDDDDLDDKDS